MLIPSIFGEGLFDELMGYPTDRAVSSNEKGNPYEKRETYLMKTDIKEKDNHYELEIELPGFKKEDIKIQLKEGYLTINAIRDIVEEKEEKESYIHRERHYGQCTRSFFVGKDLEQEDIKAKFDNGILSLTVPKQDKTKKVEQKKFISIE